MSKSDTNSDVVSVLVKLARDFAQKGDKSSALDTYERAISLLNEDNPLKKELESNVQRLRDDKATTLGQNNNYVVGKTKKNSSFLFLGVLIIILFVVIEGFNNFPILNPVIKSSTKTILSDVEIREVHLTATNQGDAEKIQSLVAQSSPSVISNITQTPDTRIFLTIKAYRVHLRSGPHINHPEMPESYEEGIKMEVVGKYSDWFYVKAPDGQLGWLFTLWVSIDPSQANKIKEITQIPTPPIELPTKRPGSTKEGYPYP